MIPAYKTSSVPHGTSAESLLESAALVRLKAHAPYSGFMVGAAILASENGRVFTGCNAETENYDVTHAEEAAIAAMVAAGVRSPLMLAVVGGRIGGHGVIIPPCGKCRQVLMEFSSRCGYDMDFIMQDEDGPLVLVKLSDLLPLAFSFK